jgi:hypothetical protein
MQQSAQPVGCLMSIDAMLSLSATTVRDMPAREGPVPPWALTCVGRSPAGSCVTCHCHRPGLALQHPPDHSHQQLQAQATGHADRWAGRVCDQELKTRRPRWTSSSCELCLLCAVYTRVCARPCSSSHNHFRCSAANCSMARQSMRHCSVPAGHTIAAPSHPAANHSWHGTRTGNPAAQE